MNSLTPDAVDPELTSGVRRSGAKPADPSASEKGCMGSLRHLIERQIIPRLLEANRNQGGVASREVSASYAPTEQEIAAFAHICVSQTSEEVLNYVEALILADVDNESIFLKLLAPAARHLGKLWEDERAHFTQVTVGLLRMHQITHRIGYEYLGGPLNAGPARRVMLACAPGSQHILGLAMVSEFFRKNGWQVVVEIADTPSELHQAVQNEWFDLVGLSVSLSEQLDTLPALISGLKQRSRNPKLPVLLGGHAFFNSTVSASDLGADAISDDALKGVEMANALVGLDAAATA